MDAESILINDDMKILVMDWPAFGGKTIIKTFSGLGHEVECFDFPQHTSEASMGEELGVKIAESILKTGADIVFSFNFFPVVAAVVHACRKKYISWVYDNPAVFLYSMTVFFPENYIFHFDSYEAERLKRDGVEHVFYLPMASDTEGYDAIVPLVSEVSKYGADVAMIGSMYHEKFKYFEKYTAKFDDFLRGYLDGLINVQEQLYGVDILESSLTPQIMEMVKKNVPLTEERGDSYETAAWKFANYYLAMRVTAGEREHILDAVSKRFKVNLYTTGDTPSLADVRNMGTVEYYKEAPLAIKCAKININVTLRSIHTGIPQRVMDIMGCGGFVLSNYQADMCDAFVPDEDFVYYESIEDAVDKTGYYLEHEDERLKIAANGYEKVKREHNFISKCKYMLEEAGKDSTL